MSNSMIAITVVAITIAQLASIALLVVRLLGWAGAPLTPDEKQSLAIKVVGLILGVVFLELLQYTFLPADLFPQAAPFVLYGLCGIVVGAGGDSALGIVKLFGATAQLVKAQTAKALSASSESTGQLSLIQGESLKAYPLTEFTDTELRAIANKFGTLPSGDISRASLVIRIVNAVTSPSTP